MSKSGSTIQLNAPNPNDGDVWGTFQDDENRFAAYIANELVLLIFYVLLFCAFITWCRVQSWKYETERQKTIRALEVEKFKFSSALEEKKKELARRNRKIPDSGERRKSSRTDLKRKGGGK